MEAARITLPEVISNPFQASTKGLSEVSRERSSRYLDISSLEVVGNSSIVTQKDPILFIEIWLANNQLEVRVETSRITLPDVSNY